MNMKATALFMVLLAAAALAAGDCDLGDYGDEASAGQAWYSQEEFRKAGDCYREAEDWDKCIISYLKAARISELKWNLNEGPLDARSEAMLLYNSEYYEFSGLGSDMGKCVYESGDTDLDMKLDAYHEWLEFWVSRQNDPPFDMADMIDTLETGAFPPAPAEQEPIPEVTEAPTTTAPTTTAPTTTQEPEQPSGDMTGLIVGVIVLIVLVLIVGGAYFLKKKK